MSLDNLINLQSYVKKVPNQFPTCESPYRIAFIGEAPGAEEDQCGVPFSGASGRLLTALLSKVGILRAACFVGNICQVRPPNNDLSLFEWDGEEIQSGIDQLRQDLHAFRPNIIVLLGNTPLRVFGGNKYSISDYRGTLFKSELPPFAGYKCMASFHPAAVLRQHDWMPLLTFDLQRALSEGTSNDLTLPSRNIRICYKPDDAISEITNLLREGQMARVEGRAAPTVSTDLEGYTSGITCISFARTPNDCFVIPFTRGRESHFDLDDECNVWRAISELCSTHLIGKKLQNCLYDSFVTYHHKFLIANIIDDTMLKHWEIYSELPKSLAFQTSIYTKEPFYKSERKHDSQEIRLLYNGKDSCVTDECELEQQRILAGRPSALDHYRLNMQMLLPLLYMQIRGIKYDEAKRTRRVADLTKLSIQQQSELDTLVPLYYGPWTKTKTPRKVQAMNINVDSHQQMKRYLYEDRSFQPVFKITKGQQNLTTNEEALLKISKRTTDPVVHKMLKLRQNLTRIGMLGWRTGVDGRMRCGYNLVGTKTGRLSCSTSSDGTGGNAQTVTEDDRDLYIPDPGYYLFQCDLSGADGWTVAAHCKRLGDSTMLDDLIYGIKVARVIALMFKYGPDISKLDRPTLYEKCKEIKKDDPIYFGSKCCQHGTNYGMGKVLLSNTIFKESEGDVIISASDSERLQRFYLLRYPGVQAWHRWVANELKTKGSLTSTSGHTRRFFGRPNEHDTLKEALSNEPQENTTYATNLAMLKLWNDPANRRTDGSLRIEPLHSVHDALVGQFKIEDTDFAVASIRRYFQNPIDIAAQTITIPFEGRYGSSWGTLTETI